MSFATHVMFRVGHLRVSLPDPHLLNHCLQEYLKIDTVSTFNLYYWNYQHRLRRRFGSRGCPSTEALSKGTPTEFRWSADVRR